jgi:hypothetical protein
MRVEFDVARADDVAQVYHLAERHDHDATFDGVGPRFLSRCVFLLLDGPIAAAAGKQGDG